MFRTYDDWKLATPPEYEEGPDPEEEDEPSPPPTPTEEEEFWSDPCWADPSYPV